MRAASRDDCSASCAAGRPRISSCCALVGSYKAGVARTVYALMVANRTNWSAVTIQRPLGTKRAGTSLPPYHAMDGSLSFLTHNPTSCLLFES